jgi:hypothetical protein
MFYVASIDVYDDYPDFDYFRDLGVVITLSLDQNEWSELSIILSKSYLFRNYQQWIVRKFHLIFFNFLFGDEL